MQVQENDGTYQKPELLNLEELKVYIRSENVRRVIVFPTYGEDGKPTPELRKAWRRYNRTRR